MKTVEQLSNITKNKHLHTFINISNESIKVKISLFSNFFSCVALLLIMGGIVFMTTVINDKLIFEEFAYKKPFFRFTIYSQKQQEE